MTARRQGSTTSLARFIRDEPDTSARSIDFCNSFWGPGDGGVDVLFARMRGAARTMEELRAFWRERAAIEDDYAKRLAKLSKQPLGRDEIGELRNSLDCLRAETEGQASAHAALCQSIRREIESPANEFVGKQAHHKKTSYLSIEKAFKSKQQQESIVAKLREKYKTDCVNINLYTAQSTLVQGRDLDRIHVRLDKAKQTVVQNERDYANAVAILQDTCHKWEADWKVFCDHCQDIEDERIEFIKDNIWAYANGVSTVCVSDDESCEKVRVTLEQLEPEKDMENFVRDYGTGPNIPEPPRFHSYSNGSDPPTRPSARPSQYTRSSSRSLPTRGNNLAITQPLPQSSSEEESSSANVAGVGALGRDIATGSSVTNSVPHTRQQAPPTQNGSMGVPYPSNNGPSRTAQESPPRAAGQTAQARPQEQSPPVISQPTQARPLHGNAPGLANGGPMAVRGSFTGASANNNTSARAAEANPSYTGPTSGSIGDAEDPIAKALEALKQGNARKRTPGSIRRAREDIGNPISAEQTNGLGRSGTTVRNEGATGLRRARTPNVYDSQQHQQPQQVPPPTQTASVTRSLSRKAPPPARDNQDERNSRPQSSQLDLQNAADSIVGAHPSSRPSSPAPPPSPRPQAAFMQPPQRAASPSFVDEYQQALPGERAERRMSMGVAMTTSQQPRSRPTSPRPITPPQEPFAGIGAHGRSPSPQPMQLPPSRATSPAPASLPPAAQQQQRRPSLMQAPPSDPRQIQRAASPTGVAIDARGQVAHDALAEDYTRRNQQAQYQRATSPQVPSQQISQPTGPSMQAYPTGPNQGSYAPPPTHAYPQSARGPTAAVDPRTRQGPYGVPTVISSAPPPSQPQVQAHQRQGSGPPVQQSPPTGHLGGQVGYTHQRPPHLQQPTGPPPQTAPPPPPQQPQGAQQQQQQFYPGHPYAQQPPPTVQPAYAPPVQQQPPMNAYVPQQQQPPRQQSLQASQTGYNQPTPPAPNAYGYPQRPPQQQQQAPPPQQVTPQHMYQQTGYTQQQLYPQQQPQQPVQRQQTLNQPVSNQQPLQMARTPSPRAPPTSSQGNNPGTETLEDGTPILFYVRALYDYSATIDEEFDFQSGDIIAVAATPEDGWWSGVLLDDARRVPGRTVFPSNFVCLF